GSKTHPAADVYFPTISSRGFEAAKTRIVQILYGGINAAQHYRGFCVGQHVWWQGLGSDRVAAEQQSHEASYREPMPHGVESSSHNPPNLPRLLVGRRPRLGYATGVNCQ